jgi:hypothetical protein
MLDVQSIEDCLGFLSRTQLAGNEVAAFTNVVNRLQYQRQHLIEQQAAAVAQADPGPVPLPKATRKARRR